MSLSYYFPYGRYLRSVLLSKVLGDLKSLGCGIEGPVIDEGGGSLVGLVGTMTSERGARRSVDCALNGGSGTLVDIGGLAEGERDLSIVAGARGGSNVTQ